MKFLLLLLSAFLFSVSQAQIQDPQYGESDKLFSCSFGMQIIGSDESNIYFVEKHKPPFAVGMVGTPNYIVPKIIVYDKQTLRKVTEKKFNEEPREQKLERILFLNNRIYFFYSHLAKNSKSFTISGFAVNNKTLNKEVSVSELISFSTEKKHFNVRISIKPSGDSNAIMLSFPNSYKEQYVYNYILNLDLKETARTTVQVSQQTEDLKVEDIHLSSNGHILILANGSDLIGKNGKGKEEYTPKCILQIFNQSGNKLHEITNNGLDKPIVNPKLKEIENNILLVGGFSQNPNQNEYADGFSVMKVDLNNGKIISETHAAFDEANNPTKEKDKKASKSTDFNVYSIVDFRIDPSSQEYFVVTQSLWESWHQSLEPSKSPIVGDPGVNSTVHFGNILCFKLSQSNKFDWISVIPREHKVDYKNRPVYAQNSIWNETDVDFSCTEAFWGSTKLAFAKNSVYIFFNDHSDNEDITSAGKTPKKMYGCIGHKPFVCKLNYDDGNVTRKTLTGHHKDKVSYFTKGFVTDEAFYFPLKDHSGLISERRQFAIARAGLE